MSVIVSNFPWRLSLFFASLLAFSFGCGGEEEGGSGSLTLSISGEEAALTGYPVPDEPELAFVDGWSLRFETYLVSLGNIRLEDEAGSAAIPTSDSVIVDLSAAESQEVFHFEELGAKRWERFSYDIPPAKEGARRIGQVSEEDVAQMVAGGWNYLIRGVAEKDGRELRFVWGLENPTRNDACINEVDGKPGIVIRNNATAEYEITLHLDHLFYDTLGDHDGLSMRFEAIAAVAEEGEAGWEIPFEKLKGQRLASLQDAEGQPLRGRDGQELSYDPGSIPLEDQTLYHFLLAASKAQGRFNGEGYCANADLR